MCICSTYCLQFRLEKSGFFSVWRVVSLSITAVRCVRYQLSNSWTVCYKIEDGGHPEANGAANGNSVVESDDSASCVGDSRRSSRRRSSNIVGVTGLRNLGNTCYMNSILQVLRCCSLSVYLYFCCMILQLASNISIIISIIQCFKTRSLHNRFQLLSKAVMLNIFSCTTCVVTVLYCVICYVTFYLYFTCTSAVWSVMVILMIVIKIYFWVWKNSYLPYSMYFDLLF